MLARRSWEVRSIIRARAHDYTVYHIHGSMIWAIYIGRSMKYNEAIRRGVALCQHETRP